LKHQTLDQLHTIAEINKDPAIHRMTQTQRLERWAELLDRHPHPVTALEGTEYQRRTVRNAMRAQGSPISVAFEDTLLREEGLANDTYGEAKRFFELSDGQLHRIVCNCHVGSLMQSSRAAYYVRAAVKHPGFLAFLRRVFT
jgi:hypothetical protein